MQLSATETRTSTGLARTCRLPTDSATPGLLETQTQPSTPTFRAATGTSGHRPTKSWVSPNSVRVLALTPRISVSPPRTWQVLVTRCESLQTAVRDHRRSATRALTTRMDALAEAKASAAEVNYKKADWRHSRRYQRTKAEITHRLLSSEAPEQAKDREIILRTVSPTRDNTPRKPFVTIESLTPNRLRSLSKVSQREFGSAPLSKLEIKQNLQRLNHPGLARPVQRPALTVRAREKPGCRQLQQTSKIHEFIMKQHSRISRNSMFFHSLQRRVEIAAAMSANASPNPSNVDRQRHTEGKRAPKLYSETMILDQLVKTRIVKMQRKELL